MENKTYQYKRITVKIGSNVLTRRDGTLDITRMSALVDQVAELHKAGVEIVLVSCGAVASGRSELKPLRKLDSVDQRQLFSAVGQAKLINRYYELFREHGITVGQVLTTKESFSTRRHYLNQRNCMKVMLETGILQGALLLQCQRLVLGEEHQRPSAADAAQRHGECNAGARHVDAHFAAQVPLHLLPGLGCDHRQQHSFFGLFQPQGGKGLLHRRAGAHRAQGHVHTVVIGGISLRKRIQMLSVKMRNM